MLTAAIIGLGQAGSRFDEEPRPVTWSHAGAYLAAADRYRLIGGADIKTGNRDRFIARCPDVPVFAQGAEMVAEVKPDVISVCTPPVGRADLVDGVLAVHRPKVLICEKPLEVEDDRRHRLVDACAKARVPLLVNYSRRYTTVYRKVREALATGRLGKITSITVIAPNRLWSVGSHAVNLLLYLACEVPDRWRALPLPALEEDGEPACDLLCRFPSGVAGRVLTTGFREMLVFEVDIVGRKGRVRIHDNGATATFNAFTDSPQYLGYRVLGQDEVLHQTANAESTFEILVREAADLAEDRGSPSSTGDEALVSEEILGALAAQCATGEAA